MLVASPIQPCCQLVSGQRDVGCFQSTVLTCLPCADCRSGYAAQPAHACTSSDADQAAPGDVSAEQRHQHSAHHGPPTTDQGVLIHRPRSISHARSQDRRRTVPGPAFILVAQLVYHNPADYSEATPAAAALRRDVPQHVALQGKCPVQHFFCCALDQLASEDAGQRVVVHVVAAQVLRCSCCCLQQAVLLADAHDLQELPEAGHCYRKMAPGEKGT